MSSKKPSWTSEAISSGKPKMLELFCGSANMALAFEQAGFDTFTVDCRQRKEKCTPDLRMNIAEMCPGDLPTQRWDHVHIGLPCDVWSYAAGAQHWKNGKPVSEKCLEHIDLLYHVLWLLANFEIGVLTIENPRGKLRHYAPFVAWMNETGVFERTVTLSSYGHCTTKPTNIFTNNPDWIGKPLDAFGRGAKTGANFNNLTVTQRQETPLSLGEELAESTRIFLSKGLVNYRAFYSNPDAL